MTRFHGDGGGTRHTGHEVQVVPALFDLLLDQTQLPRAVPAAVPGSVLHLVYRPGHTGNGVLAL